MNHQPWKLLVTNQRPFCNNIHPLSRYQPYATFCMALDIIAANSHGDMIANNEIVPCRRKLRKLLQWKRKKRTSLREWSDDCILMFQLPPTRYSQGHQCLHEYMSQRDLFVAAIIF